jgi:hypothetical protein
LTLELHAAAGRELDAAAAWYEARQAGLGEAFLHEISRAFDVIRENPRMWPVWPGWRSRIPVRRFILSRFPFCGRIFAVGLSRGCFDRCSRQAAAELLAAQSPTLADLLGSA